MHECPSIIRRLPPIRVHRLPSTHKRLGYAALDVNANEPRFDNRLRDLPKVILQPHQATAVLEARIAMGQLVIDNLAAHFQCAASLTDLWVKTQAAQVLTPRSAISVGYRQHLQTLA